MNISLPYHQRAEKVKQLLEQTLQYAEAMGVVVCTAIDMTKNDDELYSEDQLALFENEVTEYAPEKVDVVIANIKKLFL